MNLRKKAKENNEYISNQWLVLAISSLVVAGALAVVTLVGRVSVVRNLINDVYFAKKCLVVHVNLSLGIWLQSFLAAALILSIRINRGIRNILNIAFGISVIGVALMLAPLLIKKAKPILSNYIPVIDHNLFILGLVLFGASLFLTYTICILSPEKNDKDDMVRVSTFGLKSSAFVFILSILTLIISVTKMPLSLNALSYYELIFWGMGHLLQISNIIGMISIWIILINETKNAHFLNKKHAMRAFAVAMIPCLFALPLAFCSPISNTYYFGFTKLMKFGIWPTAIVFLTATLFAAFDKKNKTNPYFKGIITSVALTIFGFFIGFAIKGQNTLIPAHYHSSIGGVTATYMTASFFLIRYHESKFANKRYKKIIASAQPVVFGLGTFLFSTGFALSGANGAERKTFFREQIFESVLGKIGLAATATGGAIAVIGGIIFLSVFILFFYFSEIRKNPKNMQ